jgi:prepilin signal peptidase PulO-like enzyme (type II secretory pathway)
MIWFIVLGFIIGTVLGSFVKALADRSLKRSSFWGRSYCERCKTTLRWYDLFPILSYLSTGGKCRYCHKKIGPEYLIVEVTSGLLIATLFYLSFPGFSMDAGAFEQILFFSDLLFKTFFIAILVSITITDLRKTLIPDRIMFPSIFAALFFLVSLTVYKIWYLFIYLSQNPLGQYLLPPHNDYFRRHALITVEPLIGSLISAFIISGFFLGLIIITRGRGMGGGDVKLGFFMGLGLGFPGAILATVLGFVTGAITAVLLIILGKKSFGQNIPFGPFLVLGSLITLFWGNQIINWYLHLS